MMEPIRIHTGRNSFRLVDAITSLGANEVHGKITFRQEECFLGIEALAQLAALHVRYLIDYQEHAFLLKIEHCSLPAKKELSGTYELYALQVNRTARSYAYRATLRQDGSCEMRAEILVATRAYADTEFERKNLEHYYRKVVECLLNA